MIGPYRIVRQLGAGGMGTVHEAVDTTLHRNVALKVITGELADDPGFRARFVREAQAQASLDSPHVVQVFAHGQADGRLYIVSQLVPDGDLGVMLRRHGPPPAAVGVELIAQVADGLAEAHRVGLVHRDIKPANVLLRNRGTDTVAYLADFGIVGQLGADHGATVAEDVHALGGLLWATLTGKAPRAGMTVPQLPGRTPYDRELNRVLRTALAHQAHDCYPSAAAFRDDLRSLARTPPAGRRRPAALVAAALAATAALVVPIVSGDRPKAASQEQAAIADIARVLEEQGEIDAREADCTARQLVEEYGVVALQDEDLIDDAFSSAFSCLWSTGPTP